jgi:hypothetical protein
MRRRVGECYQIKYARIGNQRMLLTVAFCHFTMTINALSKDDWLNCTHILKVAGLDKPQRTRILERDVQKGEHEKVQGGYGKYQGESVAFWYMCAL